MDLHNRVFRTGTQRPQRFSKFDQYMKSNFSIVENSDYRFFRKLYGHGYHFSDELKRIHHDFLIDSTQEQTWENFENYFEIQYSNHLLKKLNGTNADIDEIETERRSCRELEERISSLNVKLQNL